MCLPSFFSAAPFLPAAIFLIDEKKTIFPKWIGRDLCRCQKCLFLVRLALNLLAAIEHEFIMDWNGFDLIGLDVLVLVHGQVCIVSNWIGSLFEREEILMDLILSNGQFRRKQIL